jgi:hypothetical protein
MTRTIAALLSIFGPLVPAILLALVFAFFVNEPTDAFSAFAALLFVTAALTIRVYFAAWYARDKGRSGALGFFALFGLLGWLFLFVTEDRSATTRNAGSTPVSV